MVTGGDLGATVDRAYAELGRELPRWPDPWPDRSPPEDAYARVTNPQKWWIIGARFAAWMRALEDTGLARIRRDVDVTWMSPPGPQISGCDEVVPVAAGAQRVVVAHSHLGGLADGGIVLGVGARVVSVGIFPDCGCDACDSGSAAELARIDACMAGIVGGTFRCLTRRSAVLTTFGDGAWSASPAMKRVQRERVLADPAGWDELSGSPWL